MAGHRIAIDHPLRSIALPHTGDTFWNRDYPFVDYWRGGSIDGQIRAAEANIVKVSSNPLVIPGQRAVGGKADLILFRDVWVGIRGKVAALKKQGKPCLR